MKSAILGLSLSFAALAISFGLYLSRFPIVGQQVAQVISSEASSSTNLALEGTPIAFVVSPEGAGNYNLNIIKDGIKPAINSEDSEQQYDSFTVDVKNQDWYGYTFSDTKTFNKIVFQEGMSFPGDGGWFNGGVYVEVRQNGIWNRVSNLTILPSYSGDYNQTTFETYTLQFSSVSGDGIRIVGMPGGESTFTSIAELEVYGPVSSSQVPTSQGATTSIAVDAMASEWSAWVPISEWSACSGGVQERLEERTRTITSSAQNGGAIPYLSETQLNMQNCGDIPAVVPVIQPEVTTVQVASNKFVKGDTVKTTSVLKVRGGATVNGNLLGTQRSGAGGKIIDGPQLGDGIIWWMVDYTTSPDGWSSEDYLIKSSSVVSASGASQVIVSLPRKLTLDLSLGSSGLEVRVLQNYLIKKAYLGKGLNGGYFGYSTSNAVKSYQRAKGIKVTGTVGPQTRAKINAEL